MEMTREEWARFRKVLFDEIEGTGHLTLTWEQFKLVFNSAKSATKSGDGPPSVVPQYRAFQSFCTCGQSFSTYKMREDEFGEEFPACSRCGSRIEL
jgi:hypothetical protein